MKLHCKKNSFNKNKSKDKHDAGIIINLGFTHEITNIYVQGL